MTTNIVKSFTKSSFTKIEQDVEAALFYTGLTRADWRLVQYHNPVNAVALVIDRGEFAGSYTIVKHSKARWLGHQGYTFTHIATNAELWDITPRTAPIEEPHVETPQEIEPQPTEEPQGFNWELPIVKLVIERASKINRKIVVSDCEQSKTLRDVALYYASNYVGTFPFMLDMMKRANLFNTLSAAQSAGTLNCMLAEYRYRARQAPKPIPTEPLPASLKPVAAPVLVHTLDTANQTITTRLETHGASLPPGEYTAQQTIEIKPVVFNGTFTIVLNESGEYRTLRISDCPDKLDQSKGTQIAEFLSGSDNTADYTGFAFVKGNVVQVWKRFKADSKLTQALNVLVKADKERQIDLGAAYAIESGSCWRCGRKLTVPASLHRGMGPICADKL